MNLKIEFTDKEVTPWGGIVILKRILDKIGFEKILSKTDIPKPGSNRDYSPTQLVISFMVSIWCGANRFLHTEVTRQDGVIKNIFGWKKWQDILLSKDFLRSSVKPVTKEYSRKYINGFLIS
jgi:hypothetical protein